MPEFKLEIITPERVFFSGMAESITINSSEGSLSVLAGHAAMAATAAVGEIVIRTAEGARTAFTTGGFLEVRPDETIMFAQKCEWPEEIDQNRARADEELAQELLLKRQSNREYRESSIMLVRALARLRVANTSIKGDR